MTVWIIERRGESNWYPQGRFYGSRKEAEDSLRIYYDQEKLDLFRIVEYGRASVSE